MIKQILTVMASQNRVCNSEEVLRGFPITRAHINTTSIMKPQRNKFQVPTDSENLVEIIKKLWRGST